MKTVQYGSNLRLVRIRLLGATYTKLQIINMKTTLQTLRLEILRRQYEGKKVSPNSLLMRACKAAMPAVLSAFTQAMLVGLMLGDVSLK